MPAFSLLMRSTPLAVLYLVFMPFYLLFFPLMGIRKRKRLYRVYRNIRLYFPEKNILQRMWMFCMPFLYTGLLIAESLKGAGIRERDLRRRVALSGEFSEMKKCLEQGRNVVVLTGHFGNWEWMGFRLGLEFSPYPFYAMYKPLHSSFFDRLVFNIRNQHNQKPLSVENLPALREVFKKKPLAIALVADQSPLASQKKIWGKIFGKDLPMVVGIKKIPRALDAEVWFIYSKMKRPGFYAVHARRLTPENGEKNWDSMIPKMLAELEKILRENPAQYMWSIINKRRYTRAAED